MPESAPNVLSYRLSALLEKGYIPKYSGMRSIDFYHKLNPAHAYSPDHFLCYVMLHPDGNLIQSHYGDGWEITPLDADGFENFIGSIPYPTKQRMLKAAFARMARRLIPPIDYES